MGATCCEVRTVSHQLLVAVMALKAATWMQPSVVCGWRAASGPRDPLFLCLPCASATHPMVSGAPRHRVIHSCWHGGNCQKRLPARRAAGCCTVARGTQWRLVMRSMPRCHATSLAASLAGCLAVRMREASKQQRPSEQCCVRVWCRLGRNAVPQQPWQQRS